MKKLLLILCSFAALQAMDSAPTNPFAKEHAAYVKMTTIGQHLTAAVSFGLLTALHIYGYTQTKAYVQHCFQHHQDFQALNAEIAQGNFDHVDINQDVRYQNLNQGQQAQVDDAMQKRAETNAPQASQAAEEYFNRALRGEIQPE